MLTMLIFRLVEIDLKADKLKATTFVTTFEAEKEIPFTFQNE